MKDTQMLPAFKPLASVRFPLRTCSIFYDSDKSELSAMCKRCILVGALCASLPHLRGLDWGREHVVWGKPKWLRENQIDAKVL